MGSKSRWNDGHLVFYDDPVEKTTAAGAIKKYGVTVLASSANATYTLGAVEEGLTKYLVPISTFSHVVRGATAVGGIRFGSTAKVMYSLTIAPTSKNKAGVILRGLSTCQWAVVSRSSAICSMTTVCT